MQCDEVTAEVAGSARVWLGFGPWQLDPRVLLFVIVSGKGQCYTDTIFLAGFQRTFSMLLRGPMTSCCN